MRRVATTVVAVMIFSGCTGAAGGPTPGSSPVAFCAGDPASGPFLLNLNATPPVRINGAMVSLGTIGRDSRGPVASVKVLDDDVQVTIKELRVGSTFSARGGRLKVTEICVAENLPSPVPPGTSKGTVRLADAD